MLRFIVNQDVNVWQREIILVPVLCSSYQGDEKLCEVKEEKVADCY